MSDTTVVIWLRDSVPLLVNSAHLTTQSTVFYYLIEELGLTQIEIENFTPLTVTNFCYLLQDRTMIDITVSVFRELHRLSAVFNVTWLVKACRQWFKKQIDGAVDYHSKLFVFEECSYMKNTRFGFSSKNKRKLDNLVNSFLFTLSQKDNSNFIRQYMEPVDAMEIDQLDLLMRLAGSDTETVLEILFNHISYIQSLDKNTRHLLQILNLPLCYKRNTTLFCQIFQGIANMADTSDGETKSMFNLMLKLSLAAKTQGIVKKSTTILNIPNWYKLHKECAQLGDILVKVEKCEIGSMFAVTDLLIGVTFQNPPTVEEGTRFLEMLTVLCKDRNVMKVCEGYLDLVISAVKCSTNDTKVNLIKILEMVKDSEDLSSVHDYVQLTGGINPSYQPFSLTHLYSEKNSIACEYQHIAARDCKQVGMCGFIIKHSPCYANNVELCTEEKDYANTGIHYHGFVEAQDLWYYMVVTW